MNIIRSVLALGVLGLATAAGAVQPLVIVPLGGEATIRAAGYQRATVLDADKADFEILADGIRVRGKELGTTTLVVFRAAGSDSYTIQVVPAGQVDSERQRTLAAVLAGDPLTRGEPIAVAVVGPQVTLTGTVSSQAVSDRAVALLTPLAGRLDNRLTVGAAARPVERPIVRPADLGPLPELPGPSVRPGAPLPGLPPLAVQLDDIRQGGSLELTVGQASLVSVPTEIKRALIAQEELADVVVIPPRELVVIGKAPGRTTLMLWYLGTDAFLGQQERSVIQVQVVGPPEIDKDDSKLPTQTEINHVLRLLGVSDIEVLTRLDGTTPSVILGGTVPSAAHRERAEQGIAALFPTNTRITNFLVVQAALAGDAAALEARGRALEKLLADELPTAAIRVRLRPEADGQSFRVYLSGDAALPADRLKAEQLIQFELGHAALITNNIETPIPPPPAELLGGGAAAPPPAPKPPFAQTLAAAIEATGVYRDKVFVDIFEQPKRVVLRGTVRTEDDHGDLLEAVQRVIDEYGEYELVDRGLTVREARVVTEVQIVEISASDLRNIGLSYGVPDTQSTSGGGGGGGTSGQGGTTVTANNGQLLVIGERAVGGSVTRLDPLAAKIQALVTENRAKVLSEPYISSNNDQEGQFEAVTEVPLPSSTSTTGGGATQSVEFRPVGIRLLVTPHINWTEPVNAIEMTVETEVSAIDFGISVNIAGSVIPGVTNRSAQTIVTVDDGETFVIGGLTTETERKNVSRLPFLSDIPILGSLFKTTETKKEQTTVVVVMTPRIKW